MSAFGRRCLWTPSRHPSTLELGLLEALPGSVLREPAISVRAVLRKPQRSSTSHHPVDEDNYAPCSSGFGCDHLGW